MEAQISKATILERRETKEERTEMKSFEEWKSQKHVQIKGYTHQEVWNGAIKEGIAEGRRLEREEMRCESCLFLSLDNNGKNPICSNEEIEVGFLRSKKISTFGCIHHERRTKE